MVVGFDHIAGSIHSSSGNHLAQVGRLARTSALLLMLLASVNLSAVGGIVKLQQLLLQQRVKGLTITLYRTKQPPSQPNAAMENQCRVLGWFRFVTDTLQRRFANRPIRVVRVQQHLAFRRRELDIQVDNRTVTADVDHRIHGGGH